MDFNNLLEHQTEVSVRAIHVFLKIHDPDFFFAANGGKYLRYSWSPLNKRSSDNLFQCQWAEN